MTESSNPVSQQKTIRVATRSIRARWRDKMRAAEDGGAAVEMALIFPLMATVILGIFTVGMMFNDYLNLTEAVGSGAQYLQLIRTSTTNPCADTFTAIKNAGPTLTPGNITLSFTLNGTAVNGTSCSGDQSYLSAGTPVTVHATYPCNFLVYNVNYAPSCTLSASATEYEY